MMALPVTVYINGNIFTVDSKQPWAEAVVVDVSGRFAFVGSSRAALASCQNRPHNVVDLHGSFVMPGIHDAHTHLLAASMQQLFEVSIGVESTPETLAHNLQEKCQCLQAHNTDDWLIANFYNGALFPNGKADRKYLDELFPSQPVVVRDISCHNVLANTEALKRAEYDLRNEPEVFGGEVSWREDGTLSGELLEQANTKLWLSMPRTPTHVAKQAILHALRINNEWGITSCQEASANSVYLSAVQELEQSQQMTCNIHAHIVYGPVGFARESEESLHKLIDHAEAYKSQHVFTNFVKFWLDGAPLPPYFTQCDLEDGRPQMDKIVLEEDFFLKGLTDADRKGYTCKIHVAGDGSARFARDAIAAVRRSNPDGPRHELAHCNNVHPDDIRRLAQLRVTTEMSPAIFHEKELIAHSNNQLIWPFEDLLRANVHVTIGSDWILPLTPNLFPALAAVVPRIGIEQTIRCITLAGAEVVGRAEEVGSIEVGKNANFIQLDRDLTRRNIADTIVHRTWFEGRLVWGHPDVTGAGAGAGAGVEEEVKSASPKLWSGAENEIVLSEE